MVVINTVLLLRLVVVTVAATVGRLSLCSRRIVLRCCRRRLVAAVGLVRGHLGVGRRGHLVVVLVLLVGFLLPPQDETCGGGGGSGCGGRGRAVAAAP